MKILLSSIGTRGDMEPFLAIGKLLKARGHEVICLFPEQFQGIVQDAGLEFISLGTEFIEMLESDVGKFALGGEGNTWQKIMAYIKLAKLQKGNNKKMIRIQQEVIEKEHPDRIVHNGKVMYPVIWEVDHPGTTLFVSPVPFLHYVKGHTHIAFNSNFGVFLNKLTFKLADWGLITTIMAALKWLDISNIKKAQIRHALNSHKVIYTISPQLFQRPSYWPDNLKVVRYHERNRTTHWEPSEELLTFLKKHPKLLFITFGSMTNPQPEKKTQILLDILSKNKIPALLNTAAGGLKKPKEYDHQLFHFVSEIPYDWIIPKVYGMIHHGGSGTTHTALKNGCAHMILPHIIDQFVWNDMNHELGAGPKGIKISKITRKNLEPKILDLFNNPSYKSQAEQIGAEMKKENFDEEICTEIEG